MRLIRKRACEQANAKMRPSLPLVEDILKTEAVDKILQDVYSPLEKVKKEEREKLTQLIKEAFQKIVKENPFLDVCGPEIVEYDAKMLKLLVEVSIRADEPSAYFEFLLSRRMPNAAYLALSLAAKREKRLKMEVLREPDKELLKACKRLCESFEEEVFREVAEKAIKRVDWPDLVKESALEIVKSREPQDALDTLNRALEKQGLYIYNYKGYRTLLRLKKKACIDIQDIPGFDLHLYKFEHVGAESPLKGFYVQGESKLFFSSRAAFQHELQHLLEDYLDAEAEAKKRGLEYDEEHGPTLASYAFVAEDLRKCLKSTALLERYFLDLFGWPYSSLVKPFETSAGEGI
ncbi:MAG: hypothetical protein QXG98_03880 [Candidatus Micrarchaeia archaeon]